MLSIVVLPPAEAPMVELNANCGVVAHQVDDENGKLAHQVSVNGNTDVVANQKVRKKLSYVA